MKQTFNHHFYIMKNCFLENESHLVVFSYLRNKWSSWRLLCGDDCRNLVFDTNLLMSGSLVRLLKQRCRAGETAQQWRVRVFSLRTSSQSISRYCSGLWRRNQQSLSSNAHAAQQWTSQKQAQHSDLSRALDHGDNHRLPNLTSVLLNRRQAMPSTVNLPNYCCHFFRSI